MLTRSNVSRFVVFLLILSVFYTGTELLAKKGGGGGKPSKKDKALSFLSSQIGPVGIVDSFIEDGIDYSYTYDNAMSAMAFISADDFTSAQTILDAFLNTIQLQPEGGFLHRYYSSNGSPAYGILFVGPNAYLLQAMNLYYLNTGDTRYNALAQQLADFLISLQDIDGGIVGLPGAVWKSTENNLGALSAIHNYGTICGLQYYIDKAALISAFLTTECWDGTRFLAGENDPTIVTDVQALGTLVLGAAYSNGAYWIEAHTLNTQKYFRRKTVTGFDLNTDKDTVWIEGTLQESLAFYIAGDSSKFEDYKSESEKLANGSGAFYQASNTGTTGYGDNFEKWQAVGPTAWYVLIANQDNVLELIE